METAPYISRHHISQTRIQQTRIQPPTYGEQTQTMTSSSQAAQSPGAVLQFVIVGKNDAPLYDVDLAADPSSSGQVADAQARPQYLYHFILHAALDALDDAEWTQKTAYLGTVDRFNNLNVAGYIVPGNRMRLMLLHDSAKSDELIKMFFRGVHQLLVPIVCNPFFLNGERIKDSEFDEGVTTVARTVFGL